MPTKDKVLVWCRFCRDVTPVSDAVLDTEPSICCAHCGGGIYLYHPALIRRRKEHEEAQLKAKLGDAYQTPEARAVLAEMEHGKKAALEWIAVPEEEDRQPQQPRGKRRRNG